MRLAAQLRADHAPERLEQFQSMMQDARRSKSLADETLNNEDVVTSETRALARVILWRRHGTEGKA